MCNYYAVIFSTLAHFSAKKEKKKSIYLVCDIVLDMFIYVFPCDLWGQYFVNVREETPEA